MNGKKAKRLKKMVYAGDNAPNPSDRKYHFDDVDAGAGFWLDKQTGRVLTNDQMAGVEFDYERYEPYKYSPPVQSDEFRRSYKYCKKHADEFTDLM